MVAACPLPYPRGTPVRIHRMAEGLARRGHEVHVVAYYLGDPEAEPSYRLHRIHRVPTYHKLTPGPSPQKLLVLDPLLVVRLRALLREQAFDVIHGHHYEGLLVGLASRAGRPIPVLFDAHTLLESELPWYGPKLLRRITRRLGRSLDRGLPPRADHVIAVSEAIRDRLLALGRCPPGRVTVIGSGMHWAPFEGIGPASRNGAPEATLIYTGNLAPYQGVDLMLTAFAAVAQERRGVRLHIVTDSPFEPYEPLARRLGVQERIQLTRAPFEAVPAHLSRAHVALNPRIRCEGLPQKLLNYMAAGMPIVSFAGSARGLVDGENALVIPDGDVAAFAAGIVRLLDHPELSRSLGDRARQFLRDGLSWEAVAQRVESLYHHLLREV